MKFTIKKQVLENIVSNINPYLEKRDNSAITSHIYFCAKDGVVFIKATDQELGLCYQINSEIDIKEGGEATANGKSLLDIIKGLKDGEVTLYDENDSLRIKQNRSLFKISMQKASDYPDFPSTAGKAQLNLNSNLLAGGLKKVEPCIDANNAKYEFTGALLDIKSDSVNIVGSDGKRLAVCALNVASDKEFKIILPKRAINEIQKLFNKEIELFYDETILIAKGADFTFFTKLINGKYADYERVVNVNYADKITLKRDEIIAGIKTVRTISDIVKITFSKNTIDFEVLSNVGDEAKDQIETELNINESFDILVRYKNLLDFLGSIDTATFELRYGQKGMPFIVQSENLSTIITQITAR